MGKLVQDEARHPLLFGLADVDIREFDERHLPHLVHSSGWHAPDRPEADRDEAGSANPTSAM